MKARLAVLAVTLLSSQLAACAAPKTATKCGKDATPHPEVGGELLFYCVDGPRLGTGFYLLDVASGQVRAIIADHSWNTDPAWSPDGDRIAYVSTKDGETAIYVMALADDKVTRLTRGGGWNGNPTWSPDGQWIDGTDLDRVTRQPNYSSQPSWAPDGKRVSSIKIRIAENAGRLRVEVSDDGVGGVDARQGSGLVGLSDRTAAIGGRLDVESPNGHGTIVRAELPCA